MSKRATMMFYRDQTSESRLKKISIHEGTECALLFAFLDRYSATGHRCGIWRHSPEDMALSLGMDSGDEVREMLVSLGRYGILFDAETNTLLNTDHVEQYINHIAGRQNYRTGVENHLSTLPDSPLKQRACIAFEIDYQPIQDVLDEDTSDLSVCADDQEEARRTEDAMRHAMRHAMDHAMNDQHLSQKQGKQEAKSVPSPLKPAKEARKDEKRPVGRPVDGGVK